MSKFFSKLKGQKEKRDDLQPEASSSLNTDNSHYTKSQPPAYEPPPGPPPSHTSPFKQELSTASAVDSDTNPPPYHDWTSVPDTALLPPPPALANDHSSATNASYDEAAAAHAWCARNPVFTPTVPDSLLVETIQAGQHDLDTAPGFDGHLVNLSRQVNFFSFTPNALGASPAKILYLSTIPPARPSRRSKNRIANLDTPNMNRDQTHMTRLPLYFAATSSPQARHPQSPTTIYFEIRPVHFSTSEATVSFGFAAKPYPTNRHPGWHRASLAIHSDDGNRYVNDAWGGKEFTSKFREGETLGLAMVFGPERVEGEKTVTSSGREVRSGLPRWKTRVFFVRDGVMQGGWDVDEERDAERDEGVAGLMGEADLYAAVGTYGVVEVEVRFYAEGEGFVAPPPSHGV